MAQGFRGFRWEEIVGVVEFDKLSSTFIQGTLKEVSLCGR